jgi:hypothetical protein
MPSLTNHQLQVLETYFQKRAQDAFIPTSEGLGGGLSAEVIHAANQALIERGFISWNEQTGGKLTFKGLVSCVEPRIPMPELPEWPVVSAPVVTATEPFQVTQHVAAEPAPAAETNSAPASSFTAAFPIPVEAGSFYERKPIVRYTKPLSQQRKQTTKTTTKQHGTKHQTSGRSRSR